MAPQRACAHELRSSQPAARTFGSMRSFCSKAHTDAVAALMTGRPSSCSTASSTSSEGICTPAESTSASESARSISQASDSSSC